MTRSSIRTLLAGAAAALAILASGPAVADYTFTISGVTCPTSWTLGGTASAVTLTCASASGAPTGCSFTAIAPASASLASTGGNISMTATCSGTITSWAWFKQGAGWKSDGAVATSTMTDVLPANAAATGAIFVYHATACNGASCAPLITTTFTVAGTGGGVAPTGCSIAPTPASGQLASAGGGIAVTGSCTGGGTPTAWNWQKNGVAWGTTTASQGDSLPANTLAAGVTYTYTLTACNGTSCAPATSTTFTVAGAGGGGGGGGGTISCSGFSNTIVIDAIWANSPVRYFTSQYGTGFHDGVAVVVRFTVPAGSTNSSSVGTIGSDEYGDGPHWRSRALSTQSCDWTSASVLNVWEGVGGTQRFSVGTNFGYPVLVPGQTYYFNIKNNFLNGSPTCNPGESCNIGVDWAKPPGT